MADDLEEILDSPYDAPPEPENPIEDSQEIGEEEEDPEKEELHRELVRIGNDFDQEDQGFRSQQIRKLKKNLLYWDGAQRLFWSENEDTWINVNGLITPSDRSKYQVEGNSDRVINVYRPFGESIIAAMSVGTPIVQFYPDDANNPNDLTTAKAFSKISTLLHKHNRAELIFIKALFILYNQGVVFGYNYSHKDFKFGSYDTDVYEDTKTVQEVENPLTGTYDLVEEVIPQVVGTNKNPKVRECFEVFGPLHVAVPSWCRKQEDIPVLTMQFEQHISIVRATYKEKWDEISPNFKNNTGTPERQGRLNSLTSENELCTLTVRWFRPSAYASCGDQEKYEALLKAYPEGCKVVSLNDDVLECIPENMDDHWTVGYPIFSETIHQEPQGSSVVDIQEIRNDLINNVDESFRQAIPETFAEATALDWEKYEQAQKRPGQIFKATAKQGKSLADSFHTLRTATISQESETILRRLDADGQFCSGAFPSIFGGQNTTGSKTASEYAQSRSQALQRLSTYWKVMSDFWAQFMGRACTSHARNLIELNQDDGFVQKVGSKGADFVNIVIKRAELEGKIGNIEPEASENFPITQAQKRDILLQILQLKNPVLERLIYHPSNSQVVLNAIGISEINLPGADDRTKQLAEIQLLLKEGPLDDMHSSEPIDPDADDDEVHIQICRSWAVSEEGRYYKETKPEGYLNVITHLKEHQMNVQMKTMNQSGTAAPGQPPPTNATGNV